MCVGYDASADKGLILEGRNFQTARRWQAAIGTLALAAFLHAASGPAAGSERHSLVKKYDLLIRNVTVADVIGKRFVPAQDICIADGLIQRVAATGGRLAARRSIDGTRLIAMPGFVDTHTHLWQHVARGVASSAQLQTWTRKVYRLAHYASAAELNEIVSAAAGEALLNGITTVADFASNNFSDGAGEATVSAMRANNLDGVLVWWRPAVFLPWQLQDRQIAMLRKAAGDNINIWAGIGPLSFFPLPAVYDGAGAAKRNRMKPTEHSMENLAEARDLRSSLSQYLTKYGDAITESDRVALRSVVEKPPTGGSDAMVEVSRTADTLRNDPLYLPKLSPAERQSLGAIADYDPPSPVAVLDSWGILEDFLAIHGVWPAPGDIGIFGERGVSVSYNPESNMYLASGVAPIRAYRIAGVRVTLGTDGAASNDRISMFDAMRAGSMGQKVLALSPEVTAALDDWFWIRAATIEGAAALKIADRTGSLEVGKEADIMLLDRSRLGLSPFLEGDEGASALVNRASARDVRFVISNGRLMVDDGRLIGNSEAARAARLNTIARILDKRATEGLRWHEKITLTSEQVSRGWWLYRSVRAADEVAVEVLNNSRNPVELVVGFSGVTFGGTAPPTFHPTSLQRYPMETNSSFYSRSIVLQSGTGLHISRASRGQLYTLRYGDSEETRVSVAAEQIALFAAQGINFLPQVK